MTTTPQPEPVHFRRVKHGLQTGLYLGVLLASDDKRDEDGAPLVPTFTEAGGLGYSSLTWIRHHTEAVSQPQAAHLMGFMRRTHGPISFYPKLSTRFRRGTPKPA